MVANTWFYPVGLAPHLVAELDWTPCPRMPESCINGTMPRVLDTIKLGGVLLRQWGLGALSSDIPLYGVNTSSKLVRSILA